MDFSESAADFSVVRQGVFCGWRAPVRRSSNASLHLISMHRNASKKAPHIMAVLGRHFQSFKILEFSRKKMDFSESAADFSVVRQGVFCGWRAWDVSAGSTSHTCAPRRSSSAACSILEFVIVVVVLLLLLLVILLLVFSLFVILSCSSGCCCY